MNEFKTAIKSITTIDKQLLALQSTFEKNSRFRKNQLGGFDLIESGPKRYAYSEEDGWIDFNHFFTFVSIAKNKGSKAAYLYAISSEEIQYNSKDNASGYSYEDLPSNHAGIQFWNKYGNKLKENKISLMDAFDDYLKNAKIIEPENSPNYKSIPYFSNSKSTLRNFKFKPIKGDVLKNIHEQIFDNRSQEEQDNIDDAHEKFKR